MLFFVGPAEERDEREQQFRGLPGREHLGVRVETAGEALQEDSCPCDTFRQAGFKIIYFGITYGTYVINVIRHLF